MLRTAGKADTRRAHRAARELRRAGAHCSFIFAPVSRHDRDSALRPGENPDRRTDRTVGLRNLRRRSGLAEVPRMNRLAGDSPGDRGARGSNRRTRTLIFSGCRDTRLPAAELHAPPRSSRARLCVGDSQSAETVSSGPSGIRGFLRTADPSALLPPPGAVILTRTRNYPTHRARGIGRATPLAHRERPLR